MDNIINMNNVEELFLTVNRGEIYDYVIGNTEKMLIEKALEKSFGNQLGACRLLGINRNTLRTKIRKLNIDINKFK